MVKEHKVDFVFHDEPGSDLAGFGGITFRINYFDLDGNLFAKLLDITAKKSRAGRLEVTGLFKAYLKEVQKLWKIVDTLDG